MISVVVEGDTDVPFARALCAHAQIAAYEPVVSRGGKTRIDEDLPRWANAAKGAPYLVLRDLDQDAACAAAWLSGNAPRHAGRWFCLRLPIRAIEAWFLADHEAAARSLAVDPKSIPAAPDDETNPKTTIVTLARGSRKRAIRSGLPPRPGDSRRIGPLYPAWLLESARSWRVAEAMTRSPSLRRAHAALVTLHASYSAYLAGDVP